MVCEVVRCFQMCFQKHLILEWDAMGHSQSVAACTPAFFSFLGKLQIRSFMRCPLLCDLPRRLLVCPLESGRPHQIYICYIYTSAQYLCLSYNLSTVYSICAIVALKLQSALRDSKRRSYNGVRIGSWLLANWFLC